MSRIIGAVHNLKDEMTRLGCFDIKGLVSKTILDTDLSHIMKSVVEVSIKVGKEHYVQYRL